MIDCPLACYVEVVTSLRSEHLVADMCKVEPWCSIDEGYRLLRFDQPSALLQH